MKLFGILLSVFLSSGQTLFVTMGVSRQVLAILAVISIFSQCQAQTLLANLEYGTFQGTYNARYNISYWRKIPFAAPPVGENRFRGPQPPIAITNGTYNSDQSYDFCPQRTVCLCIPEHVLAQ